MEKLIIITGLLMCGILTSCTEPKKDVEKKVQTTDQINESPKEMLKQAYQLFKEGDDQESIKLANKVLDIGRETKNDTLIGRALTSLCRNAQRSLDTLRLAELSAELKDLSEASRNPQWMMYRAHMNAEMWRLIGNMDRAEMYYNESLKISAETGAKGMYTIDHFNKSFVSIAKGDFDTAKELILKYYALRKEADPASEDAYGLIALAYYLEQQGNYEGALEVAVVTRRLFEEQHLFPEPPDEKPLLAVEKKVQEMVTQEKSTEIKANSVSLTVANLLEKYL